MSTFWESLKPKIKNLRESFYLLSRNHLSLLALIVLAAVVILAILAPAIVPYPDDIYDEAHIRTLDGYGRTGA